MHTWQPVTPLSFIELPVASTLRIDTRDFHGVINTDVTYPAQLRTAKKDIIYRTYTLNEIIDTIKLIKMNSGGDGKWRHIDLPCVSDNSGWNMKYLNVYRAETDCFLLLTNQGSIISKDRISKIEYASKANP